MKTQHALLLAGIACVAISACSLEKIEQNCTELLIVDFTITNEGCLAPCQVVFTNRSENATAFEWDFGDDSPISTAVNPTHAYQLPGDYLVKLTARSTGCSNVKIKTIRVNAMTYEKTFSHTDDDVGFSVQQTNDGGYIICGYTLQDVPPIRDVFVVRTNNSGNLVWKNTFGGSGADDGRFIQQTTDGGYIICGNTSSEGAGLSDVYLIKINNGGGLTWKRTFGGTGIDQGYSVQQTADGGYIICGNTTSEGAGFNDVYLVKTDNIGNLSWKKTFGGTMSDGGLSVQQTSDGGYVICGYTDSQGLGGSDVFLIKTDNTGNLVWEKTFGGTRLDVGHSVRQTKDGGYIICGTTFSEGDDDGNVYLIKTDNAGNLIWKRIFGGAGYDEGWSVRQTTDGGYIICGRTFSEGAGISDVYLIKTDNAGNLIWKRTFGGTQRDEGYSVQQTTDGGYIITGFTASKGAGGWDVYLIKTDKNGNVQ